MRIKIVKAADVPTYLAKQAETLRPANTPKLEPTRRLIQEDRLSILHRRAIEAERFYNGPRV